MTGNIHAARLYLDHYQRVLEKATLSAAQQPSGSWKYDDAINLTDEQLLRIAAGGLGQKEQESGKGHTSNTE